MESKYGGEVVGNEIGIPDGKGGKFNILVPGGAEDLKNELKGMKPDQQRTFIADMVETHNTDRWRKATAGTPVRRAMSGVLGKIEYYQGKIIEIGETIIAEVDIDPSIKARIIYDPNTGIDLKGLQYGWLTGLPAKISP